MDTEREDRSHKRCSAGLAVTRQPRCHTVCSGGSKSVYDGCDRVLDSAHGALPIVGESVKNNSQRLSRGAFGNFDLSGRRRRRAQKETSVKAVTWGGVGWGVTVLLRKVDTNLSMFEVSISISK